MAKAIESLNRFILIEIKSLKGSDGKRPGKEAAEQRKHLRYHNSMIYLSRQDE